MKVKIRLLTLLIALGAIPAFSQLSEYNYQDYRQANTRLKQLNLIPQLSGRSQTNSSTFIVVPDRSHLIDLNIGADYLDLWNAPDLQNRLSASTNVSPAYSFSEDEDIKTNRFDLQHNLSLSWIRDNFIDYDRLFWGWNFEVREIGSFEDQNVESGAITDQSLNQISVTVDPKLRFGTGRLENITNAWQGYRILQRLHYLDLTKDFTNEEINGFGNFIDELRAMRVFDARLTYLAHLRLLDNYLRYDLGLDAIDGIRYFSELNDMWRFGISENRIMGKKFTFQVGPLTEWAQSTSKINGNKDETTFQSVGAGIDLIYQVGQPVKTYHQFNWGAEITTQYNMISSPTDFTEWLVQPSVNAMWGYYPTTRTEYEFFADVAYFFSERNFENTNLDDSDQGVGLSIIGRFNYWFSPRTALNGSLRFGYGRPVVPIFFTLANGEDDYNLSYSIRLTHAIF